jgi:hypothetical protein
MDDTWNRPSHRIHASTEKLTLTLGGLINGRANIGKRLVSQSILSSNITVGAGSEGLLYMASHIVYWWIH